LVASMAERLVASTAGKMAVDLVALMAEHLVVM